MKQHTTIVIVTAAWTLLASACASNGSTGSTSTAVAPASVVSTATTATTSTTIAPPTSSNPPTTPNPTVAPAPSTAPAVVDKIDVPDGGSYKPQIDPARFSHPVDNPYLPFLPGMRWTYRAINENGDQETTTVEVLPDTRVVMGVAATVVHDVVQVGGTTTEDTQDWYAQDDSGNVWYMGEDTTAYDPDGSSSKEGSWEAGVHGAQPGIVMPAQPAVTGTGYRQEYLRGSAEDMAIVVATGGAQQVGTDAYSNVVTTQEWSPLEPDTTEQKSYAPNVGVITEDIVRGGSEHVELVDFTPPS